MIGNCLFDTAILIRYLRGDKKTQQSMENINPYVSIISMGELYLGVHRAQSAVHEAQKIRNIETFAVLLPCDADTAKQYAQIKHGLWLKGRPIPENDIWIAATAIQYGLLLVTRDAHFDYIAGLSVEQW